MVTVLALYKILKSEKVMIVDKESNVLYEGISSDVPIRCMDLWVTSLGYKKGCYIIITD